MKRQYRISTSSNWVSNYGYAFMVIMNTSGSGKKLTFRSMEVQVQSTNNGSAVLGNATASLYQCSAPISGEDMVKCSVELDSSSTIPSTVVVRRNSIASSYASIIKRVSLSRRSGAAGTQNTQLFGSDTQFGYRRSGGAYRSSTGATNSTIEPIIIPNGSAYVMVVDQNVAVPFNSHVRVNIVASINNKTVIWDFASPIICGLGIFSIENTGSNTVKILNYSFAEFGTNDTPTIRMVPVGQLYSGDIADTSKQQVAITKMDTSYPTLTSSTLSLYSDIGFIPYGVPEVYFSEGSAGSPKGVNYLHTRDFQGPMYRNFLPELCHMKGGGMPDTLGFSYSHHWSDLLVRRSGITLNPGEGIALVASAETAVAVATAYSGWPTLDFAAQVDVEPQYSPYVSLSGLITGSDIVIVNSGTSTELVNVDSNSGTTYSWNYDSDVITSIDIRIYKSGYVPVSINNISPGLQGISIPVAQKIDRAYS